MTPPYRRFPPAGPRKRFLVVLAAVLIGAFLLSLRADAARIPAHKQAWQWRYQVWMPPVWQRVAWCESGTRPPAAPNWAHDSGTYQGAFGFYHGSWDQFKPAGYPADAHQATPWQQYRVALRIHARYGFSGWGCYDLGWVRYGPVAR